MLIKSTVFAYLFFNSCERRMASPVARTNILYVYKNLLKMAKGLPETKREQSLRTIKEDFRKNMGELDPLRVSEMLIKANSTLGNSHDAIVTIHFSCFTRIVKGTSKLQ
jgi:hypothetical protein